jgi:hypothetical protein
VERDLVDPQVTLEIGKESDQRLADRSCSDDVYDLAHEGVSGAFGSAAEKLPRQGTAGRIR